MEYITYLCLTTRTFITRSDKETLGIGEVCLEEQLSGKLHQKSQKKAEYLRYGSPPMAAVWESGGGRPSDVLLI